MRTLRIVVAYDGTGYVGWQRQASGVSIQSLLEDALRELDGSDVAVTGAGRTDAGVHALAQVAAFTIARELSPDALVRALNARLPDAVRVLSAEEAPAGFHPRYGAKKKTYRYRLWNADVMDPFARASAWHVPGPLDVAAMRSAARLLEGRHDFAAFQASGSSVATTEREIFASAISHQQSALSYEVTGSGFLRHMVRIIVGSLIEVGAPAGQPVEWIADVIASRDRTRAGPTAPPHGLFLVGIEYAGSLADVS